MNTWKIHIENGNEFFRNEHYSDAEAAYILACERSEKLFHHWLDADEIVAAITTSYFNLAESLKCQERYRSALAVLEKIDSMMMLGLGDASINLDRRMALLKGRNKTRLERQRFCSLMSDLDRTKQHNFDICDHALNNKLIVT